MNQEAIGKFIMNCRKEKNLTQKELADKLNVTDRAVSKWENGRGMPDSSIMLDLCNNLGISVNELLSGKKLKNDESKEMMEENFIDLVKINDNNIKKLFIMEMFLIINSTILFILSFILLEYGINKIITIPLCILTSILFIITIFISINIETKVGFYECRHCHYKFIPNYKEVFFKMHIGRTKYLKCPKCNKRSWMRKEFKK